MRVKFSFSRYVEVEIGYEAEVEVPEGTKNLEEYIATHEDEWDDITEYGNLRTHHEAEAENIEVMK
jgi:hypothetical protein